MEREMEREVQYQQQRIITWVQFAKHTTPKDCWVLINQNVYNVSDYLVQHPGGDDILLRYSGTDGTQKFTEIGHSQYAKSLRNARFVGKIQSINNRSSNYLQVLSTKKAQFQKKRKQQSRKKRQYRQNITKKQISLHCSQEDCWIIIDEKVYEVTQYLREHPGGVGKIMQWAGKDATKSFEEQGHSLDAVKKREELLIGSVASQKRFTIILIGILLLIAMIALYWHFFSDQKITEKARIIESVNNTINETKKAIDQNQK